MVVDIGNICSRRSASKRVREDKEMESKTKGLEKKRDKEIHCKESNDVTQKISSRSDGICCFDSQGIEPFSLTPTTDESMECGSDLAMHASHSPPNQV